MGEEQAPTFQSSAWRKSLGKVGSAQAESSNYPASPHPECLRASLADARHAAFEFQLQPSLRSHPRSVTLNKSPTSPKLQFPHSQMKEVEPDHFWISSTSDVLCDCE